MAPYRLYFVGTQLLFLSHVANSFILLTANMEDVKKIARKFVSDSLAEKIAEFVAKATEQIVANVSEENDENAKNIQNLSNEDQLQNIGRQRLQKDTKTTQNDVKVTKYDAQYEKEYEKEEKSPKDVPLSREISNAGQVINWEKEVNNIAYNSKYSNEVQDRSFNDKPEADYEQQNNNVESKPHHDQATQDSEQQNLDKTNQKPDHKKSKTEYKTPKFTYEWQKVEYEQQDPEQKKPDHESKPDYELRNSDYEYQKPVYEKPKTAWKPKSHTQNQKTNIKEMRTPLVIADQGSDKPRSSVRPTVDYTILHHKPLRNGPSNSEWPTNRGHRLTGFDSQESVNQTIQPALGFNIPRYLTTKKEREEFDQYDNPKYPKSEFIATSGPVALPKVPMMKPWWEKEMETK